MQKSPLPNGDNGDRDALGRFKPGNPGGPGNLRAAAVARYRAALAVCMSDENFIGIVRALIEKAASGDLAAIREVLDRTVGKSATTMDIERHNLAERRIRIEEERAGIFEDLET